MSHTPEPWEATKGNIDEDGRRFLSIVDSLNRIVVQTVSIPQGDQRDGSPYTREANDANAARIVACVNGCAGLTNLQASNAAKTIAVCNMFLAASDGLNPAAYRQVVEALNQQHQALDWCLAKIVSLDNKFYPSKSPAWQAVVAGNQARVLAEGKSQCSITG